MTDLTVEEWRPITDWEGLYKISSLGNVCSLSRTIKKRNGAKVKMRGRVLRTHLNTSGYPSIRLLDAETGRNINARIHRLIAEEFLENPDGKPYVNHKDCDKSNSVLANLEWVTPAENSQHAVRMGRGHIVRMKGEDNPSSKLTRVEVLDIKARLRSNESVIEIARRFGISRRTTYDIKNGTLWSHAVLPPPPTEQTEGEET